MKDLCASWNSCWTKLKGFSTNVKVLDELGLLGKCDGLLDKCEGLVCEFEGFASQS